LEGFSRRRIETALLEEGLITPGQLEGVFSEQRKTGKRFAKVLLEQGLVGEETLLAVMEKQLKIPRVNLSCRRIDPAAAGAISAELALRRKVIPLEKNSRQITLAMADPLDLAAVDEVAMVTGAEINPVLAEESAIDHLVTQFYSLEESDKAGGVMKIREGGPGKQAGAAAGEAPVIRVVNSLIERGIEEGASDIHLEPTEEGLRLRMRRDGVLHDISAPPGHSRANIISRVKIMADLDVAEKRRPQDGNIQWRGKRKGISLRVSTLPTIYGEKVVIRFLEKEKIVLPLERLGFSEANYRTLLKLLLNRQGMLLVTGPTGCGKTTTLYSALNYLNRPEENIITVEDPVEYRLKGINQVQVNPRIERTFAGALRSILRQDPNIIMVGEIRDLETAQISTRAALTGHLVLSTLHTNSAAGAITRLVDMGIEDYLVAASLNGVIAQRLVRKICPVCRDEYSLSEDEKLFHRRFFRTEPPPKVMQGKKCRSCNHTGYRGRTSIQEILVLNQGLKELILSGAKEEALQDRAVQEGMTPLVTDGLRLVEAGQTTVNEIVRAAYSSILDGDFQGMEESFGVMERLKL